MHRSIFFLAAQAGKLPRPREICFCRLTNPKQRKSVHNRMCFAFDDVDRVDDDDGVDDDDVGDRYIRVCWCCHEKKAEHLTFLSANK